jgi:hypothetical protein
MTDLVTFLHARLDKDEEIAFAAGHGIGGLLNLHWDALGAGVWARERETPSDPPVVAADRLEGMPGFETARVRARHIADWDPDRVMGEVQAKRAIIRWHTEDECCSVCLDDVQGCPLFRTLALPYADHPDYQDAWRP